MEDASGNDMPQEPPAVPVAITPEEQQRIERRRSIMIGICIVLVIYYYAHAVNVRTRSCTITDPNWSYLAPLLNVYARSTMACEQALAYETTVVSNIMKLLTALFTAWVGLRGGPAAQHLQDFFRGF